MKFVPGGGDRGGGPNGVNYGDEAKEKKLKHLREETCTRQQHRRRK